MSCMQAIILLNSDSFGVKSYESVQDYLAELMICLQTYLAQVQSHDSQKFAKLLLILPELKVIVNQLLKYLFTLVLDSSENETNNLLAEMIEAKARH